MIFFSNKCVIPKQGGGVPDLVKIPTFSRAFFLQTSLSHSANAGYVGQDQLSSGLRHP